MKDPIEVWSINAMIMAKIKGAPKLYRHMLKTFINLDKDWSVDLIIIVVQIQIEFSQKNVDNPK